MKIKEKIGYFFGIIVCFLALASAAQAATPTTLSLTNTTGDAVQVTVSGSPSSTVQISYLPPGAAGVITINFGTTDANGNFSTSISSGGFGIPAGAPAFAVINGAQSSTMLWPAYTSTISLSQNDIQIAVGQSITIGASNSVILAANSLGNAIATAVSGSQITITGLASGAGTLVLCGSNVGCGSVVVQIGAQSGQTQITFSESNVVLTKRQTRTVSIFGGSHNGYILKSNSNSAAVDATIPGTGSLLVLYGTNTLGTAAIVVCSTEISTNCSSVNVTVLSGTAASLSFSRESVSLIPGLSQSVTVSGGPDNNYYIASNSNSGVAQATISGSTLTLVGGSNAGTTTVNVCSAVLNNYCGTLSITTNISTTTPSASVLAFSQNVATVVKGETTNVSVSGGTTSGYVISSNSNPSAVTASILSGSNIVSLYGNNVGTSIVTVCSTASNTVCASLSAIVEPELVAIVFGQSSVTLSPNQSTFTSISGGNNAEKVISENSNPSVVEASVGSGGGLLILSAKNKAGSAAVTVCSANVSKNCATINITVTAPVVVPAPAAVTPSPSAPSPITTSGGTILGTNTFKFTSLLQIGSKSNEVSQLQKVLKNLGYFTYPTVTGFFGAATKQAVVAFQKAKNLKPYPGWVGPGTRTALNSL